MINREKVRMMTELAMFQKKEDRGALEVSEYRKKDYVALHMIKIWLSLSVGYALMTVLLLVFVIGEQSKADRLEIPFERFLLAIGLWVGIYAVLCVMFIWMAYVCYSRRYSKAVYKVKYYRNRLRRLERFIEKEAQGTGELNKDSGREINDKW